MIGTLDEMKAICAEWQERLRLQDWKIYLAIVRKRDFTDDPEKEAEITIYWLLKEAKIKLIDPIDFDPETLSPQDMEVSIVHELLHIHFGASHGDEDNCDSRMEEQAICLISQAFVNLKREGNYGETDCGGST